MAPFLNGSLVDSCASQFYRYAPDAVRCLDARTLHRLLRSPFLRIENEDGLLRLLLDIGVDPSVFASCIEIDFLSGAGLALFVEQLSFDELTEQIWAKLVAHLRAAAPAIKAPAVEAQRFSRGPTLDSVIVQDVPQILNEFKAKRWVLLYRGSRDGFRASVFQGACNGRANTVTLVKTKKGFVFGGFTPVEWNSSGIYTADPSSASFLFSVTGSGGRRFRIRDAAQAICGHQDHGPIFGPGHDFYIADNSNVRNSTTRLGRGYLNDTGKEGTEVLAGERTFTVEDIEVFTIQ
jgi:hypothetical protein